MLSHRLYSVKGITQRPGLLAHPSLQTGLFAAPASWNAPAIFTPKGSDAEGIGQSHGRGYVPRD